MPLHFHDFLSQYQLSLTAQQQEAVQAVDGPVLVLAVPGAGKTTVLIARLGYMLLCKDISPRQILTVTYTVSTTHDMRQRFAQRFGADLAEQLEFRTINGICAKIIAAYGRMIGRTPFSLQTDEGEILRLIRDLYLELVHEYPTESELSDVRTSISYIKNMELPANEQQRLDEASGLPLSEICRRYTARMKELGQMDYDDQMVYAKAILLKSPTLTAQLQNLYRYICVDEAQDTSLIQHEILQILAKGPAGDNLFLVGDEDQSIYGFRAAFPQALLHFEQQHAGARVLLMEDNFRSDASIVEAAGRLIARNKSRHPKSIHAVREARTQVRILPVKHPQNQYSYLLKAAENLQTQTAVLYRNNESALPLIDLLDRNGLPYRIRSKDSSFFTSRVVYDLRYIYQFLKDPRDTDSFLQIYYKLNLYLNKKAALRLCEKARQGTKKQSILTLLTRDPDIEFYIKKAARKFNQQRDTILGSSASTALALIRNSLGYGDYLQRAQIGQGKMNTLELLARQEASLQSFFERLHYLQGCVQRGSSGGRGDSVVGPAATSSSASIRTTDPGSVPIAAASADVSTAEMSSTDAPFRQNGLILSTIHASKGLEYDRVFLLDVGDGIFPSMDSPKRGDKEALALYEEERRIFYVGMTRAKDYLGIFVLPSGSAFVQELQSEPSKATICKKASADKTVSIGKSAITGKNTSPSGKRSVTYNPKAEAARIQAFTAAAACGSPVHHEVYGSGRIQQITGKRLTVLFDNGTQRSFDLNIVVGKGFLRLS